MAKTTHRRFGNVRQLPSGRWQARWAGDDGRSHKAPDTFESADAARVWLAGEEKARATNRWVDERAGAETVGAVAAQWQAETVHKRASTVARDGAYIERYVLPAFGDTPVSAVRPGDVATWVSQLRARPLSPATVRKAAQLLGAVLEVAVRDQRILENPARNLKLPKVEAPDLRTLTPAEIVHLADTIDARYRALVIVACHTGLRMGELCALVAGDVDLLRRRITVTRNVVEVGTLHHGNVKTAAGRRVVPLSAAAVEALTPLVGGAGHRDDLLFTAPTGGYIRLSQWRARFWAPAVAAAGLEGFRCHDMRHTAVSLWMAAGIDPKAIAAWAGHRSVVTVLDRYGHLQPDHAELFLARLDALVANSESGIATA
jgi:integrase